MTELIRNMVRPERYLISHDLVGPEADYEALHEGLEDLGAVRVLDPVWAFNAAAIPEILLDQIWMAGLNQAAPRRLRWKHPVSRRSRRRS